MDRTFDRIVIAVPELDSAMSAYQALFGYVPAVQSDDTASWVVDNTVLELVQRPVEVAHVAGLVMANSQEQPERRELENELGLELSMCDGSDSDALRNACEQQFPLRVDHLVLRTANAEGTISLFRDQLGIRLALDQDVPKWGGRMLFFRGGKMTLEVIAADEETSKGSYFWGIAYQCEDIVATIQAMASRGVELSQVRDGRKSGTRVATIKSHALDIPTLLIEPAPRG